MKECELIRSGSTFGLLAVIPSKFIYINSLITTFSSHTGTIIVPAVAVIGAIVAVVIGVVLWRKFRARSNSLEGQQLIDGDQI